MIKIFLAGTFRTEEDEQVLASVFDALSNRGYNVWWAPKQVKRGYSSGDPEFLRRIIQTEEAAIGNSDILIAVMKRASFGTAMEIKHAYDLGKPVIAYLLSEHLDFTSGAFVYRITHTVRNLDDLLETIRQYNKSR